MGETSHRGRGTGPCGPALVLYESEEGYVVFIYGNSHLEPYRLEAYADRINFTQFP